MSQSGRWVSSDRVPTARDRFGPVRWLAFGLACAIQLYALYIPQLPDTGGGIPGLDKVGHAGIFALVMVTGVLAGVRPRLLAVLLAVHAVGSEILQHLLLPNRTGDVWDLLADGAGITMGWLLTRTTPVARVAEPGRAGVSAVVEPAGNDPDR